MAINWPFELPQYPSNGTLRESRSNYVRVFQPDEGRPLTSAGSSVVYTEWLGVYKMSESQVNTFWDFWDNTLDQGLGEFVMYHPRTKAPVTVELLEPAVPPSVSQEGKGHYSVELKIRVIPS